MLVILEPKISNNVADRVCGRFPRFSFIRIAALRFKGGIWVMWQANRVSLIELKRRNQAFHFKITPGMFSGVFTAIYGSPQRATRRELWLFFESIAFEISEP